MVDYGKIYFLENYLFDDVAPRFAKTGEIVPANFYMIVIWKANRAKTRVRRQLTHEAGSFGAAVKQIAASLHSARSSERRLEILMKEWHFRLPMASAILAVLCRENFTVYDIRVCDELGAFHQLADRKSSERLWMEY
jgi:hypothetical protein